MMNIMYPHCKSTVRWLKVLVVSMFLLSNTIAHSTPRIDIFPADSIYAQELSISAQRELKCLARNVYHESGMESWEGKIAVAQVTMNRLYNGNFGKDVCAVVHQKGVWQGRTVCQFSWVCEQRKLAQQPRNEFWDASLEAAYLVYREMHGPNGLEEALFFHAVHVNPRWQLNKIKRIGNHVFYGYKK